MKNKLTVYSPLNPEALQPSEPWLIIDAKTRRIIEGRATLEGAMRACHILNAHAERLGHSDRYKRLRRESVTIQRWEGRTQ